MILRTTIFPSFHLLLSEFYVKNTLAIIHLRYSSSYNSKKNVEKKIFCKSVENFILAFRLRMKSGPKKKLLGGLNNEDWKCSRSSTQLLPLKGYTKLEKNYENQIFSILTFLIFVMALQHFLLPPNISSIFIEDKSLYNQR